MRACVQAGRKPPYPFDECNTESAVRDAAKGLGKNVALAVALGNILEPAGTDRQQGLQNSTYCLGVVFGPPGAGTQCRIQCIR